MTLVLDRGVAGPGVHVLAIGVGAYRHLPGGTEPVPHGTFGLKQLTGPPLSALAFVEWVATRLNHPTVPLATVEVLLSPAQDVAVGGATTAVDVPDRESVTSAFERWYARCDAHPSGVALLYFCGHGIEKDSTYLLLEDFGESSLDTLGNAVDIRAMYQGMARCAARTQYVFVDACREVPFDLLQSVGGSATVLVTPQSVGADRESALLMATSGGHKAYGRPGQPTRFTAALRRALDGLGARANGTQWEINYLGLQSAVTSLLGRGDADAPAQRPQSYGAAGDGVIHVCTGPPEVPVTVACEPPAAAAELAATASLTPVGGAGQVPLAAATGGWASDVPAGFYDLAVEFAPGPYTSASARVLAFPPFCDVPLKVVP